MVKVLTGRGLIGELPLKECLSRSWLSQHGFLGDFTIRPHNQTDTLSRLLVTHVVLQIEDAEATTEWKAGHYRAEVSVTEAEKQFATA
jgi:hypothetical protein